MFFGGAANTRVRCVHTRRGCLAPGNFFSVGGVLRRNNTAVVRAVGVVSQGTLGGPRGSRVWLCLGRCEIVIVRI